MASSSGVVERRFVSSAEALPFGNMGRAPLVALGEPEGALVGRVCEPLAPAGPRRSTTAPVDI